MIGESVIVIGSSLYVFCSLFEWKQSVGYILFHAVLFTVACIPSVKWAVGITKWFHLRPLAGDGMEIGSLLVPMVLTSQMAFIERWDSKYLKVTEVERSYLLSTQLMSMLTVSILLIVNHEKTIDFIILLFCGDHLHCSHNKCSVGCRYHPCVEAVVLLSVDSYSNLGTKLSYLSPTFYNIIGIYADVTRGTHSLWMQLLLIGSLTTGLFLLPVFYYLTLVSDYWETVTGYLAFYAVICFTFFALLLPWSVLMLGGDNPFMWLWRYLDNVYIRLPLIRYWLCIVLVAVGFVAWQSRQPTSSASTTITRKCFHLLALAIYIPGVIYEPYLTHLASSVAVAAFIFIEYIRLYRIGPFGESIHSALQVFLDEKDSGPLILTHVYLLLGFAMPLWIYPVDYLKPDSTGCKLALYSGILALGIGDTMASVIGKKLGRYRWPGSLKTVEGTLAGIISQLLFLWTLHYTGLLWLPRERWLPVSAAVTVGSLLEAWTSQIDNIVLSPFLCSLLMFKCR
ncbi:hypothetical protein OS493_016539 [Desmophyllum pertusum]|uniref:dolichol kinase n=1 Tax=Desmophyllum pertusum TaxID=174260 RepID=A0A9X0D3F6_9CNID|nr:hypothetical protein OS493_016539 [Desmophyllum pertusum]